METTIRLTDFGEILHLFKEYNVHLIIPLNMHRKRKAITFSNRVDVLIILGDFNAQISSVNHDLEGVKGNGRDN